MLLILHALLEESKSEYFALIGGHVLKIKLIC